MSYGEGSMAALPLPAYNPNQSGSISLSNNMSVHLDGLQQSKSIVKEAGEAFSNTLKRMNMSSIAAAMNGSSLETNPLATDDDKGNFYPHNYILGWA